MMNDRDLEHYTETLKKLGDLDSKLQHLTHFFAGYRDRTRDDANGLCCCPFASDSARANSWNAGYRQADGDLNPW